MSTFLYIYIYRDLYKSQTVGKTEIKYSKKSITYSCLQKMLTDTNKITKTNKTEKMKKYTSVTSQMPTKRKKLGETHTNNFTNINKKPKANHLSIINGEVKKGST